MTRYGHQVRQKGRHRQGAGFEQVVRRQWDLAERAAAHQLDLLEPGWTVLYGVGTRRFYALATWPAPEAVIVQARDTDELRRLMREAEQITWLGGEAGVSSLVADRSSRTTRPPLQTSRTRQGALMPETPHGLRTVCWDLPHDLSMVGKVRRIVVDTLNAWDLRDLADDIVLVVSELLANAVTYGEAPIRLSLWAVPGEFCVRVTDHGPDRPRHLDLGLDALHGRGLAIVAALAHDHGITPLAGRHGKTVWARWRLELRNAEITAGDSSAERLIVRDLPFVGLLEAEPDFAERSEENLSVEDDHSL
ncbi:ATP-binding protein [Sphaerisporangium sp. NPDC005288]|uniref:ATP-binding protein n=1 Tax=Sphaerisporangium sp. NPDC005288 TaxID=3155114 RepID=UPI0033B7E22F